MLEFVSASIQQGTADQDLTTVFADFRLAVEFLIELDLKELANYGALYLRNVKM